MPAKSEKQRKFFEMIASKKKPTKKGIGPSPELAERFLKHQDKKKK